MPFYIAPGGLEIVTIEDMRLGLGELAVAEDGELRHLGTGESFAFFQAQDHAVGLTEDEVIELIGQLQALRKRWRERSDLSTQHGIN